MATAKPYHIKAEHDGVIEASPQEIDLDANEYHKVAGGTIIPQTNEFGGVVHGGDNQDIPMTEVIPGAQEGDEATTKPVGMFRKHKESKEAPQENVAPSGLVAPVLHPGAPSPIKRKLIKVTLDSPVFGKVTLPVVESLLGEGCTVLVTDSSDGFSFMPPVSDTPFKVMFEGDKKGNEMFYCGQTFIRPLLKEQYLLLIHADK